MYPYRTRRSRLYGGIPPTQEIVSATLVFSCSSIEMLATLVGRPYVRRFDTFPNILSIASLIRGIKFSRYKFEKNTRIVQYSDASTNLGWLDHLLLFICMILKYLVYNFEICKVLPKYNFWVFAGFRFSQNARFEEYLKKYIS